MKGWYAVCSAFLFLTPPHAAAAEDVTGAARELARRTAGFIGRGEAVSVTWRNLSSLGPGLLGQARGAYEAALREAGERTAEGAPAAAQITLSENALQCLLVEEIRKGDDRQVWIAAWKRGPAASTGAASTSLERKLVWAEDEPILDLRMVPAGMLVLSTGRLALYARPNTQWEMKASVPLPISKPLPRDPRGVLRINGVAFQMHLPGLACSGATEPALTLDCHAADDPWVLESGSRAMLLGYFAAGRNFFDGRVSTQTGMRKTVPPFYSAAAVDEQGRTLWLLAMVDGHTRVFDASFEALDSIASWGSDIAGTDAHCGSGTQVLATRAGDGMETDAVQAFTIVNRTPQVLTPPVEMPGPVTALWSAGNSAMAVARNPGTGKYEAYVLTVACGQ